MVIPACSKTQGLTMYWNARKDDSVLWFVRVFAHDVERRGVKNGRNGARGPHY